MRLFIYAALLMVLLCVSPAWAGSPGAMSLLFDGTAFRESSAPGALLVRDGMLPDSAGEAAREDPLPAGTGAVALLCYRQSAGGKLKSHGAVAPMAGVAVSVRGGGLVLAGRSDARGYLILALPPGSYQFKLFNFSKQVVVEPGKTALAFIRGGKRMVD